MRPMLMLFAALLALLLTAVPVAAHHGKGSHARDPRPDHGAKSEKQGGGAESDKQGGFAACDSQGDPSNCPGNSGWAHWCKEQHDSGHSRGQCIAEHARSQGVDVDRDDDPEPGDLRIASIDVNKDGSFRVRGQGAEGSVAIWVGGSAKVVGFGQGEADNQGNFDIRGQWACQDGDSQRARVRAQDQDERDSDPAAFPCDEEN